MGDVASIKPVIKGDHVKEEPKAESKQAKPAVEQEKAEGAKENNFFKVFLSQNFL
jgi:hypothetical protein